MNELETAVRAREITRICHFTPGRNLCSMLKTGSGVLSTAALEADEAAIFAVTDARRWDQRKTHICCSLEYPNPYYFRVARAGAPVFPDWPVLLIDAAVLWTSACRFCVANAGGVVAQVPGVDGFDQLFAPEIVGGQGKTYRRDAKTPTWRPTDVQAEVLVPDRIRLEDLVGVAVRDESQGRRLCLAFDQAGVPRERIDTVRFLVSPALFDQAILVRHLLRGERPKETLAMPAKLLS